MSMEKTSSMRLKNDVMSITGAVVLILIALWISIKLVDEYFECDRQGGTMVKTMWGGYVCAKELK